MSVLIHDYAGYAEAEILPLYESAGWINYTRRPDMLRAAYENSLLVLGAYDGERLIGILRAVGDGASILYIQDIIVLPGYQHQGVGSALIDTALKRYPDVYQTVLMTDDTEKTAAFYRKNGFIAASDMGCTGFMKINR